MFCVNVTKFRKNISHYIEMCSKEQIYITKNGEVVAVLSNPKGDYYQTLNRLCGSLKNNNSEKDHDDMIGDEIMRRCGY